MIQLKFFIRGKKENQTIYVRATEGRHVDATAKTKHSISFEDWSAEKQRPKTARIDEKKQLHEYIEADLDDIENKIKEGFRKAPPTTRINAKWLKQYTHPRSAEASNKRDKRSNFLADWFLYMVEDNIETTEHEPLKKGTVKKYRVMSNIILRMEEVKGRSRIEIQDVGNKFINEFRKFMEKENYAPGTTSRYVRFVVAACRYAHRNGKVIHPDLLVSKHDKPRRSKFKRNVLESAREKPAYLSFKELDKIKDTEFEHEYLNNARDWLIISCYTGQRVGDFLRFNSNMITEYEDGKELRFIQQKTGEMIDLPLVEEVLEILDKREGEFPRRISEQRYNDYIKEVCRIAGINKRMKGAVKKRVEGGNMRGVVGIYEKWELVSSHIGRRSFATNYEPHEPLPTLMAITGHSTPAQFYSYICKSPRDKTRSFGKIKKSVRDER